MRRLPIDSALMASLASGILLALAYPRPGLYLCAWFAFVPVLIAARQRPWRNGFIVGVIFFALVLYWVNVVMTTFGGLNWFFSLMAYLLLSGYLALYFAFALFFAVALRQKIHLPYYLSLPSLWIALEFVRAKLFSGFPWGLLGYSQSDNLIVAQFADMFGVYGIGFIIMMANAVIAEWLLAERVRRTELRPVVTGTVLLLLCVIGYGWLRLDNPRSGATDEYTQVTLVQGNIAQSLKWDPAYQQVTLDTYRHLSLRPAMVKPELIIWPESATPFYFQESNQWSRQVRDVARDQSVHLLFGSPAYEANGEGLRYFNSAFMLTPSGEISGRSDKIHLVPFGEYVPLKNILTFVDKLVVGIGEFSPGEMTPLDFGEKKAGVLVCFEGIFPELAAGYVRRGADLLVNITNDAWFGNTSAPWQHLAMTRMRAIENRIWVARAANTGVSAFIAPSGEIIAQTGLFMPATLTAGIFPGAGLTLYRQFGFALPYLCCAISLLLLRRYLRRQP